MLKRMLEDYVPVLLHVIVAVGFAHECGVVREPGPQPRFAGVGGAGRSHCCRSRGEISNRSGGNLRRGQLAMALSGFEISRFSRKERYAKRVGTLN
jgi:hypothetical protein